MTAFSHRDRRAQRIVTRSLVTLGAGVTALAALAMLAPGAIWGVLGVVALAASGAAYLIWSEQLVAEYARDLRAVRDGGAGVGFLRAEVGSSVGLERTVGRPTERSPHAGRRARGGRPGDGTVDRGLG